MSIFYFVFYGFIQKGVRDYVIKDDKVIESLVAILEGKDDDYLFN